MATFTIQTRAFSGDPEAHTYVVSDLARPGYVREILPGRPERPQVCAYLEARGDTLLATAGTLPAVIRRELRRRRDRARREA